jgi:hypothetical protein
MMNSVDDRSGAGEAHKKDSAQLPVEIKNPVLLENFAVL